MPGVTVQEFDLAVYVPSGSNAIIGMVGPATKGPVDQLNDFTDEGNFVNTHGRPVDHHHGPRAAIRYLSKGNQLKYVRIAGTLLKTALKALMQEVSGDTIPIITFSAITAGSWANGDVKVNIQHNGNPAVSYNLVVYFLGQRVESHNNLTNSTVENVVNRDSRYIQVALHTSAGTTFPDSTLDDTTEQYLPLVLADGNDGAFASTKSPDSSAGGVSAQNAWAYVKTVNTTTDYSEDEGRAIAPGSLVIATTAPVETFADNGKGILTGTAGGTGLVNYQTGAWSVSFFAAPTADVAVAYSAGNYSVIGSSSSTAPSDSGTLDRVGVVPDTVSIRDPREDVIDIGDGATAVYNMTLATNIVPGSLQIVVENVLGNVMTVTDNGDGTLGGDVGAASTIVYVTGVLNVTFSANVKNLAEIISTFKVLVDDDGAGALAGDRVAGTINYQIGAWTLVHTLTPVGNHAPGLPDGGAIEAIYQHCTVVAFGDNVVTDFSGTLDEYPVKVGTVTVVYAAGAALTDNGDGTLSGAGGEGTIDYDTGAITLEFTGAPAAGFAIQALYDSILLDFVCKYSGPIGNERSVLADGLFIWVDRATNTPTTPRAANWYRVRVLFNDGSGSIAVETFDNLPTLEKLLSVLNNAETGSQYVTAARTNIPGELDISYDTNVGQKLGMAGAFTPADVIGTHIGPAYTGLQHFANEEIVPAHFITTPGMWHRQIQLAGIELCEKEGRHCVWLFSIPDFDDPYDARDFVNGEFNALTTGGIARPTPAIPYPPLATISSSYAFCVFSWLQYYDQYADAEVWEPGEGELSRIIAFVDKQFETWYPIAGLRRGKVGNISDLRYSPEKGERALIYGVVGTRTEVINPLVKFIGQGVYLYGQRTMSRTPTATDRLHVRWTANILSNSLLAAGRWFNFELNDEVLWREVRSEVIKRMSAIAAKGGIYDYRVVCDATTNTPEVIANEKKTICKIFIQWVEASEEMEFQMIYTPTTADFSEVAPVG